MNAVANQERAAQALVRIKALGDGTSPLSIEFRKNLAQVRASRRALERFAMRLEAREGPPPIAMTEIVPLAVVSGSSTVSLSGEPTSVEPTPNRPLS